MTTVNPPKQTRLADYEGRIVELVRAAVEEAVCRERNRCVEIAKSFDADNCDFTCQKIIAAIYGRRNNLDRTIGRTSTP